jgi:hypothetical protein
MIVRSSTPAPIPPASAYVGPMSARQGSRSRRRAAFSAALALVSAALGLAAPAVAVIAPAPGRARPALAAPSKHVKAGPHAYGCPVLPAGNALNRDVSRAPVDPRSAGYIASIGPALHLHADFGTNPGYGIPYVVVGAHQQRLPIKFSDYGAQSDPGPYPVPPGAPVEGAGAEGDRHVLVLQTRACKLYELYAARRLGAGWEAGSGAVFNLRSNALRPEGWTSADAAGLPILPLLARYPEVHAGRIEHALRVTVARTQRGYIHPATHLASSSTDPSLPPMGLRLRLKASFDLAAYHGQALVILRALQRYGLIVADNGSSWYITGAPDPRWSDVDLDQLKRVPGSAFEAIGSGPILHKG